MHGAHVADVMEPPEWQTCAPVPVGKSRRWLVCDDAWWCKRWCKSLCGAGAAERYARACWAVWRLGHGARATSDVLAALYLPEEQAEQPVLQLESQLVVGGQKSQSLLQLSSQSPPKKSQP